ncbi:uncharacterized protein LOC141537020, partial [Cotesia typhae]|uniref:uncharacterized protein LOC141537020 n=1 Tax=Cotesia typhae TaxID=2053667 RepID=UPI003D68BBE5
VPNNLSYEELANILRDNFQSETSAITRRYKFKECRQLEGEDIKQFIVKLKKAATKCEFGVNLEDNLRDQFIFGLRSNALRKRLLSEPGINFQKAKELATVFESTANYVIRMTSQQDNVLESVNIINNKNKRQVRDFSNKSNKTCYCCGKENHTRKECRYQNYRCNECNQVGHLAVVCKNKLRKNLNNYIGNKMNSGHKNFRVNSNFSKEAKTNYNYIVDEETDDIDDDLTEMFYFDVDVNDSVVGKGIKILYENFYVENNGLLKDNKTKENNDKLINGINIIKDQIHNVKPLTVNLIVEGKLLEFEIDTSNLDRNLEEETIEESSIAEDG